MVNEQVNEPIAEVKSNNWDDIVEPKDKDE
jgi:hypothetical protein